MPITGKTGWNAGWVWGSSPAICAASPGRSKPNHPSEENSSTQSSITCYEPSSQARLSISHHKLVLKSGRSSKSSTRQTPNSASFSALLASYVLVVLWMCCAKVLRPMAVSFKWRTFIHRVDLTRPYRNSTRQISSAKFANCTIARKTRIAWISCSS